jgi:rod shape-determining protein MreD
VRDALAVAVAAALALLMQTTLLPVVLPRLLVPNLTLALVVWLGLRRRGAAPVAGAFLLGYSLDAFSGTLFGVHALAMTLTYGAVHAVAQTVWTEGGLPVAVVAFGAGLVYTTIVGLVSLLAQVEPPLGALLRASLAEAALTAIVTPSVFRFVNVERRLLGAR